MEPRNRSTEPFVIHDMLQAIGAASPAWVPARRPTLVIRHWSPVARLLVLGFSSAMVAHGAAAAAPVRGADPAQKLAEFEQTQQAVAERVTLLQDQLTGIEGRIAELQDHAARQRDDVAIDRDMLQKIRNENLGLYVMDSSTKEMITTVGGQVEALSAQLEKFRISAGILVALVVALQAFGIAMLFVRRG